MPNPVHINTRPTGWVLASLALGLLLSIARPATARPLDLQPFEGGRSVSFEVSDKSRGYLLIESGETVRYRFPGPAEVDLLSRALIPEGKSRASYALTYSLDGDRDQRIDWGGVERAPEGRFAGVDLGDPAQLMRHRIQVGRGWHSLELRGTGRQPVAIRLRLDRQSPVERRWRDLAPEGDPERLALVARDGSVTPYHRFSRAEPLSYRVGGPGWFRVLVRSEHVSVDSAERQYVLEVKRHEKLIRRYHLTGKPSESSTYRFADGIVPGVAREIVIQVPEGEAVYTLRPVDLSQTFAARAMRTRPPRTRRPAAPGSQAAAKPRKPRWRTNMRLEQRYDSNILRISDRYIQRFEQGTDPARFRVESLDDMVVRPRFAAYRDSADRRSTARVSLDGHFFVNNDIKNWVSARAGFNQKLGRANRVDVSVGHIPDFYVRHFRDGDLPDTAVVTDPRTGATKLTTVDRFRAFDFSRSDVDLRFERRFSSAFTGEVETRLAQYDYSESYNEFDSDDLRFGVRLDHTLSKSLRLTYRYRFLISDARGTDQPGETALTSDDTDPSFEESGYYVALRWRRQGHTLRAEAEYFDRSYTTDRSPSIAPLHVGRQDERLRITVAYDWPWRTESTLGLFARLQERTSSSDLSPVNLAAEKNFEQYEFGLRLGYRPR